MRIRTLLPLLLLAACSGAADDATPAPTSADAIRSQVDEKSYRFHGGDDVGDWLFRLRRQGDQIEGHAVLDNKRGQPGLPPGPVKGTVDAQGQYKLTWSVSFKGESQIPVEVKAQGDDLVGTYGEIGDSSRRLPIALKVLKPGTLADDGRPIAVTFALQKSVGACQISYSGAELFGLADEKLEAKINDALDLLPQAEKACIAKVGAPAPEGVMAGASLGVLRKDLVAHSSYLDVTSANDGFDRRPVERANRMLGDGSAIKLWGDVLQAGKDAELQTILEAAVDRFTERDMVTATQKEEWKGIVRQQIAQKKVATEFLLTDRGVAFATPGFSNLRYRSVLARYDALQGILASNGRAKSAWLEAPATP